MSICVKAFIIKICERQTEFMFINSAEFNYCIDLYLFNLIHACVLNYTPLSDLIGLIFGVTFDL